MIKMNKVTVTKLQMEAIERQRDDICESLKTVLDYVRVNNFCSGSEPMNLMSEEQIVLAYYDKNVINHTRQDNSY